VETDPPVPPALQAAFTELDDWALGQLAEDTARSTPKRPLYHYTGEAAFKGILETQTIWSFRHDQQSDPKEFSYSLRIAQSVILEEEARENDLAVRSLLDGLHSILNDTPLDQIFEFYLFSLSAHRDHARQWTEYGDKGRGFAIGLAPALFQPNEQLSSQADKNVFVGRVIYGDDQTRTRHRKGIRRLAQITRRIAQANRHLVLSHQQVWFDGLNRWFIGRLLIWNCLTAKVGGLRCEEETRRIHLDQRKNFDGLRKIHTDALGGVRNYVEEKLPLSDLGNITEILVGPNAPDDAEAMVSTFLRSRGYPNIPINRSGGSRASVARRI
jgi:hypothetical protein